MDTPSLVSAIGSWALSLCQLHQRLSSRFARPEVRQHALLSDIPRKNGWQITEQARQSRPYGIQRLLSRAAWDEDGVRDDLRSFVCQTLHPPPLLPASAANAQVFPVLVIDESGFPKRGHHSAGVAPQYCGASGQVENCQVGVFLDDKWSKCLIFCSSGTYQMVMPYKPRVLCLVLDHGGGNDANGEVGTVSTRL